MRSSWVEAGEPGDAGQLSRAIDYGNEVLHGSRRADSYLDAAPFIGIIFNIPGHGSGALYRRSSRFPIRLSMRPGANL